MERKQQIRTLNWNNELLKKIMDQAVPKQFVGGRERRNFETGSSSFFKEWSPFTQWSAGCKGWVWVGLACTVATEEGVLNFYICLLIWWPQLPAHPSPSSPGRIIQETEAVVSAMINFNIGVGLPILMFTLISHLKLIFSIQLQLVDDSVR